MGVCLFKLIEASCVGLMPLLSCVAARTASDLYIAAMKKFVRNIRGEDVAFTGKAWLPRAELQRIVRHEGGFPTAGGNVSATTTVLVRGDSSVWAFGEFGTKERKAAELLGKGARISLVHDDQFRRLVETGRPARVADRIAGDPVQWLERVTKRRFEGIASIEGPLDREHTSLGRVEQSYSVPNGRP